jgi:site-specific DNA-methyltransferase (adenine-specific)
MIERGAGWEMHLGDCIEVMSTLEKVDHVITDPPYDERTHAGAVCGADGVTGVAFDPLADASATAAHILEAARRWCLAFCAVESIGDYARGAGKLWVRAGIWDKINPTPQLTGDRPGQAVEAIAIMHASGKKRWNKKGEAGIWRCRPPRGDDRPDHPTPKPVDLMLALVADFTDPEETILDPFAGSGTTGVACLRLGRKFIGIEKDPTYFALACERLRAEEQGSTLQAARAGQMALLGGGK